MVDPLADVGAPDLRSPVRFLLWIARCQRRVVIEGGLFGIMWMGSQAAIPAALGGAVEAIDDRSKGALVAYSLVILGLGIFQSVAGILRHRRAVLNFLVSASRVEMLVARHAALLGSDLSRHVVAGEIANIGANDVERIGSTLDVTARFTGAVFSYAVVAVVLLVSSPELGAVILIGAPVIAAIIGPLMRPLERRQSVERDMRTDNSTLAADTVVGLRVLRGLGGEETFSQRFRHSSQRLRAASVRSALSQANLDALQILLPGLLLVTVTWLGARLAIEGQINPGQLVSFYAYTAFLVLPMRTITEMASKWTAGTVAAGRVIGVLERRPDISDPVEPAGEPGAGDLVDETTGLHVETGKLTIVASADPAAGSALAERLGRYGGPADAGRVFLNGVPLDRLATEVVRRRVLVVPSDPVLLAGTVRDALDPPRSTMPGVEPVSLGDALAAASLNDVVDGLVDGLDTELPERGRTLSGGQRQRLVLAQAILADPEILVLDEPTSAVDAHTEAAIAKRLRHVRAGKTTVVFSTSPLMLEQADRVAYLDGVIAAEGPHATMLASCPSYRHLVMREISV